jgi:small subunit ribosomal protein S2
MKTDGTFDVIAKREKLLISREREKLEKTLGSISELGRLPQALFIVDITKEHIAVAEAKRLGIVTFGIVDTNSDPNVVDYAIPANDDATKSIQIILDVIQSAILEGLSERKVEKDKEGDDTTTESTAGEKSATGEDGKRKRKTTKDSK